MARNFWCSIQNPLPFPPKQGIRSGGDKRNTMADYHHAACQQPYAKVHIGLLNYASLA